MIDRERNSNRFNVISNMLIGRVLFGGFLPQDHEICSINFESVFEDLKYSNCHNRTAVARAAVLVMNYFESPFILDSRK